MKNNLNSVYPTYPTHSQFYCKHDNIFTDTVPCAQDPAHLVRAFCWDCHMTFGWDPETTKPAPVEGGQ